LTRYLLLNEYWSAIIKEGTLIILWSYGLKTSMENIDAFWGNKVVKPFFGGLKHD
jgi:hypothetical protein